MEKINLVELLKDCPTGMELDCTMFEGIEFDSIVDNDCFPIRCRIKNSNDEYNFYSFTKRGYWNNDYKAKCVIFPKGRTTWKGFVPPCQFKDGDIISNDKYIAIFYKIGTPCHCTSSSVVYYHCYYSQKFCNFKKELDFGIGIFTEFKYATEEERQKLFNVIKANGYKWNAETKTLEKLIEPKFKVGNRIKRKKDYISGIITNISDDGFCRVEYLGGGVSYINLKFQDDWEFAPDKFNINTLVPFESKVLVRNVDGDLWKPAIYGFSPSKGGCYVVGGIYWKQCIPYEGNQHLRGKTNDCDDYYKNWK